MLPIGSTRYARTSSGLPWSTSWRPDRAPAGTTRGRRPDTRPKRPLTAAQQRAREVDARRGPAPPRDPDAERQRIDERTLDVWIDEGAADVRDEAAGAAARAASEGRRKRPRPLDPDVSAEVVSQARDARRGHQLAQRLADAEYALERDRLDDARRAITPLLREVPSVAAVHEVAGLTSYRLGRWREAVKELEAAQALKPRADLLPVLADSYRALRRWSEVERIWATVRELSPAHEVLAEARIVAAGAQADRGDLTGALRMMANVPTKPRTRTRPSPASVVRARRPPRSRRRSAGGGTLVPARGVRGCRVRRRAHSPPCPRALGRILLAGGQPTLPRRRRRRDRAGERRRPGLRTS